MPVEKIPSWIKQVLMPEFNEIKGKLENINTRMDALDGKIDSLRNETKTEIEGLRKEMLSKFETTDIKIDSLRNETKMEISGLRTEMTVRLDSIEKHIPVIEELTVLKLKIADIEKRLAVA